MAKEGSKRSFSVNTQSSLCWWAPWTPICNPAQTPHFLAKKKTTKEKHGGGLWHHLPSFWVNPEEEEIRINYRALKKLSVFMITPSGNSDNCTINGGITTEDLPCLLKPAMLCAGS